MDEELNVRAKTIKLLGKKKNIELNLYDLGFGSGFLVRRWKV